MTLSSVSVTFVALVAVVDVVAVAANVAVSALPVKSPTKLPAVVVISPDAVTVVADTAVLDRLVADSVLVLAL